MSHLSSDSIQQESNQSVRQGPAVECPEDPKNASVPVASSVDSLSVNSYTGGDTKQLVQTSQQQNQLVQTSQQQNQQLVKRVLSPSFGARFKQAFGPLKDSEIARELRVSDTAIKNYAGGRVPPAEMLVRIAKLTSCSVHWLLTGEGPREVVNSDTRGMLVRESSALFESGKGPTEMSVDKIIDRKIATRVARLERELARINAELESLREKQSA